MFNKLKVKVAEEVKNSHQRLQQFTQSFTEKIENAPNEENFFTIGDDDEQTSSSNIESGFSNVPLTNYTSTPNSGHIRRSSNTSIASDISILPRYDSPTNLYHMQSDLDVSASEVEDNASTSSQLGHLSKEQIYSAFRKSQQQYHKYRGRYTDIAKHYKDLEKENTKIRYVLVDTQDKALRRIAELREQCSLEQKAKAHLENSLRVDLDEKQYVIDSLKTKVDLLQSNKSTEADKLNLIDHISENELTNGSTESLTKELNDAKTEIDILNAKMQEMKANSIVFNSKEIDLKKKIAELEETNKQKNVELSEVLERERENNLIIAQTKMELHTEIQNRDIEIEKLKHDIEVVKLDYESKLKGTKLNKLENLQAQNTKLIEKVEQLTLKCNNYESDLLKIQHFKIENQTLQESIEVCRKKVNEYEECVKEKEALMQHQKLEYENEITMLRDNAKQSLLALENKIVMKLQDEFSEKEKVLTSEFQEKIQRLTGTENSKETRLKLLDKVDEAKSLEIKQKELEAIITKSKENYNSLETNHLELISECSDIRNALVELQIKNQELLDDVEKLENSNGTLHNNLLASQEESSALYDEKTNLLHEVETIQKSNVVLQNEITQIRQDIESLKESNVCLENENKKLQNNTESDKLVEKLKVIISDLQSNIHNLKEEKSALVDQQELLQNEKADLQSQISSLDTKMTAMLKHDQTFSELSEQCTSLQEKLNDEINNHQKCQIELNQKENALLSHDKLTTEFDTLQKVLQQTQQTLQNTTTEKVEAQDRLKEAKSKFEEEIHNLNSDIHNVKEQNQQVQKYIDDYKLRLADYEKRAAETATQLQTYTKDNLILKKENAKLRDLIETSDSINNNLTKQLNDLVHQKSQIHISEQLINNHVTDTLKTLPEKIKLITDLNLTNKEKYSNLETEHSKLNSTLKETLSENNKLKKQIEEEMKSRQQKYEDSKLEAINHEQQCKSLNNEIAVISEQVANYKNEISKLKAVENDYQKLQTEKVQIFSNLSETQATVDQLNIENSKLNDKVLKLQQNIEDYKNSLDVHEDVKAENSKILEEIAELKRRNNELSLDYKQITAENEEIVTELAETKLKFEITFAEKSKSEEVAKKIEIEKAELLNELKQYRNELDKLKTNSAEMENIQELENILTVNKNLKLCQTQLEERCASYEKQQKVLEGQLRELEHQYTEISHERQLLHDEIQELKISPINITNAQKVDTNDLRHSNGLGHSNEVNIIIDNHQKEIDDLNEKLVQYKSLDLTNRSSLQFYENELEKVRNKNEKLNRKLDETLVTLNHCAELSHSTETEYLKNVVYNYMLGKESLVLARVIAAVCKFDETQTNTILQKEQQKQTLLGQLGLL